MYFIFIIILVCISILYSNIMKNLPVQKKKAAKNMFALSLILMLIFFFGFGYIAQTVVLSFSGVVIMVFSILIIIRITQKKDQPSSTIQKPEMKSSEPTPMISSPLTTKECSSCGNMMLSNEKCCRYCGNPNPEYKSK